MKKTLILLFVISLSSNLFGGNSCKNSRRSNVVDKPLRRTTVIRNLAEHLKNMEDSKAWGSDTLKDLYDKTLAKEAIVKP